MEHPNIQQLDFGFELEPTAKPKPTPKSGKKAQSDFVFDFMDCLTSPIIVYPSAWQDAVPKQVLDNITLARLLTQMQGERMASLTEVVAYMMPRTYEAPMPNEWANIYTWCGLQFAKTFKNAGQIGAMMEIAPKHLSDYEQTLLKRLRIWIFEKRRKALKAKLNDTDGTNIKDSFDHQKNLFDS